MDPIKILTKLENQEACIQDHVGQCQYYNGIYDIDPFEDSLFSLWVPKVESLLGRPRSKKQKKRHFSASSENNEACSMDVDFAVILQVRPDFKLPLVTSKHKLRHLGRSVDFLASCIMLHANSLINEAKLQHPDFLNLDPVTKFNALVDIYANALENVPLKKIVQQQPDANTNTSVTTSNMEPFTDIAECIKYENERKVIKEQLRCVVLSCNWILELTDYINAALGLNSENVIKNPQKALEIALGIKECNRNLTLYSHVHQTLSQIMHAKENRLDKLLSTFMTRRNFFKQVINADKTFEPKQWIRLQMQMSNFVNHKTNPNCPQVHAKTIEAIRREMQARMAAKKKCDILQKEHESALQQLSLVNGRQHEIDCCLDNLKRQLKELMSHLVPINQDFSKVPNAKFLPFVLHKLLDLLFIQCSCNPMRLVLFRVARETPPVSFEMLLQVPNDLVMPNLEAASLVFPLVFKFTLEPIKETCGLASPNDLYGTGVEEHDYNEGPSAGVFEVEELQVQGVVTIHHIRKGPSEFPINEIVPVDAGDWGCRDFPAKGLDEDVFQDQLNCAYIRGQACVWDVYSIQEYKHASECPVPAVLLPSIFSTLQSISKYEYMEGNMWRICNDAASIVVSVDVVPGYGRLDLTFSDFKQRGQLEKEFEPFPLWDLFTQEHSEFSVDSLESVSLRPKSVHKLLNY